MLIYLIRQGNVDARASGTAATTTEVIDERGGQARTLFWGFVLMWLASIAREPGGVPAFASETEGAVVALSEASVRVVTDALAPSAQPSEDDAVEAQACLVPLDDTVRGD